MAEAKKVKIKISKPKTIKKIKKSIVKKTVTTKQPNTKNKDKNKIESKITENDRKIGSLMHFIKLIDLIMSPVGFIISIVLWIQNRNSEYINKQGKILINGLLSGLIYAIILGLSFLITLIHELTGIIVMSLTGVFILAALICISIIGPILAGISANNGEEVKNYPLAFKILK